MKRRTAYRVAIEAIQEQIQTIVFDANLFDAGVQTVAGERRAAERDRLLDAIRTLEAERDQARLI